MSEIQESPLAVMRRKLEGVIETVRQLLPAYMKPEAERHVKTAYVYFCRRPELHSVTQSSFIQCVVDAAESGIPLNGRLGHAVAFNCKVMVKDDRGREVETWEKRAQFMPDYKGLVAVARRTNQVRDIVGDVVCENDEFDCRRDGNRSTLFHKPGLTSRGKVIGAYAIITPPEGEWRYEYMTIEQLEHVRRKSKAKDNSPWVTDTEQMQIKTVLKRALKMYADDPTLIRALDHDDAHYESSFEAPRQKPRVQPVVAIEHKPSEHLDLSTAESDYAPADTMRTDETIKRTAEASQMYVDPIDVILADIEAELASCDDEEERQGLRDARSAQYPDLAATIQNLRRNR